MLSWKHTREGGRNFKDGHNVVLHEFSHQLDQVDGVADGVPVLECDYQKWVSIFGKRYIVNTQPNMLWFTI